eukprot:gene6312-biopygen1451
MDSSCSCDLDEHIRALLKSDVKDIENVFNRILQQRTEEDACDVVLYPKVDVFRSAIRAQDDFLDELKGKEKENADAIEKARMRIEVSSRVMNHLCTQLIDEKTSAKEKLDQLRDIQADRRNISNTVDKVQDELASLRCGDKEIRLEMNNLRHKTKLVVNQRSAAIGKIRALEDELTGFREKALAAEAELLEIRERLGGSTARLVVARAELVDANAELERTLVVVEETRRKVLYAQADGSSFEDELTELSRVRSELADTKSELADTKSELSGVRSELADTKSELAETTSDLSGLRSELADTKSELAETTSELSGVRSDLADTKSELSGVNSELDVVYSELKSVWDSKSELETTSNLELERTRSEIADMNSMLAKAAVSPDQLKFPGVPIISDVTTLGPLDVIASSARVGAALGPDLITASFPCQDVSMAGKGVGLSGTRSSLVWDVFRVLDGLPSVRAVFLENSPALRYRGLDAICEAFETRCFSVRYGILSSADVGARHVRSRIWVLAARDNNNAAGVLFPYLNRTRLSSSISQSLSYPFAKLDAEMPRLVTRSPGESGADVRSLTLQWQALGNAIVPQAARFAFAVLLTDMRSESGGVTTTSIHLGRLVDVGLIQYPVVVRPCLESLDLAKAEFYTRLYYPGEDRLWRSTSTSTTMSESTSTTMPESSDLFTPWLEITPQDLESAKYHLDTNTGHCASRNPLIFEALAECDGKTIDDVKKEVCCFLIGDMRCGDFMQVMVWPFVKDNFCTSEAACNNATAHDVPAPELVYLPRPLTLTDASLTLEVTRHSCVLERFKDFGLNCGKVSRESMVRSTILALVQVTKDKIDEMDDVMPFKFKHSTLTYKRNVLYRELEKYGGRPDGHDQHVAMEMRNMGVIANSSDKSDVTVVLGILREAPCDDHDVVSVGVDGDHCAAPVHEEVLQLMYDDEFEIDAETLESWMED